MPTGSLFFVCRPLAGLVLRSAWCSTRALWCPVRYAHLGVGIPPDNHLWLARDLGQRGEQLAGLLHGLHAPAALPLPGRVASHHHPLASRCDSPLTDNAQVCNALREYGTCQCTRIQGAQECVLNPDKHAQGLTG